MTCAHVIEQLHAGVGDTVGVRFTGKGTSVSARVLPEYWRPDDATDIAILQVDEGSPSQRLSPMDGTRE